MGICSRFPYPPPPYEAISASTPRPTHTQSKPVTPPGATSTYIRVAQGRKIRPSKGQIKEPLKAALHTIGLASHQMAPPTRGPKRRRIVKKQHMFVFLFVARAARKNQIRLRGSEAED